jgi:hypothetical protein
MVQNDLFDEFAPCRFGRVSDSRNNGGKAFLRDPKLLRPKADFTRLGHLIRARSLVTSSAMVISCVRAVITRSHRKVSHLRNLPAVVLPHVACSVSVSALLKPPPCPACFRGSEARTLSPASLSRALPHCGASAERRRLIVTHVWGKRRCSCRWQFSEVLCRVQLP